MEILGFELQFIVGAIRRSAKGGEKVAGSLIKAIDESDGAIAGDDSLD